MKQFRDKSVRLVSVINPLLQPIEIWYLTLIFFGITENSDVNLKLGADIRSQTVAWKHRYFGKQKI